MVKKVCFFILSMLFLMSANVSYSQENNIEGIWSIYKVAIEKNVEGESTTTTYNKIDDIKSFMPCPAKIIINSDKAVFEYSNGKQEAGTYVKEGNKLKVSTDVELREYQYECLDSGNITISYATHYLIDGIVSVKEYYTFYGERN